MSYRKQINVQIYVEAHNWIRSERKSSLRDGGFYKTSKKQIITEKNDS